MKRYRYRSLLIMGLLAAAGAGPARAESATPADKKPAPEEKPAVPATAPAAQDAAAAPAKPSDPRDQEIQDLKKIIQDLQKRVEGLEKRPVPPAQPAEPPTTTQPEQPATPPATPAPTPDTTGAQPASGSATFLPNISAIGNIIFGAGDTRRIPNRGRFNFDEFEIAFQDAVAPKLRYDVFLSADKGDKWKIGMEEGYLTATALAPGLSARLGEIRVPFGKFNPLHSHVWPFITQPSASTAFLGPDGLIADGGVAEYILPIKGMFAQAQVGAWQTASDTEQHLGFTGGGEGAYSGRLWFGKELSRDKELELGFSRYEGNGDVKDFGRRRIAINGMDFTYRLYPGQGKRILFSAELMDHQTDELGSIKDRLGGFAYMAYRMNQFWEWGLRGDYTKFPYPLPGYDAGGSVFLTRYLTEQTSLRLQYQYMNSPHLGTGNALYFQILFGSGPHTHPLQ